LSLLWTNEIHIRIFFNAGQVLFLDLGSKDEIPAAIHDVADLSRLDHRLNLGMARIAAVAAGG
jgi:hypothetical protein